MAPGGETVREPGDEATEEEAGGFGNVESDVESAPIEAGDEDRPEGGETERERTERRGRRRRGRGRGRDRERVREGEPLARGDAADDEHVDSEGGDFEGGDFEGVEEEEGAVAAEAPDEHDVDPGHDFEDDEEHDDEDGGESPRIGFRNIPTWQDAIGMMIAKNMESRARNPGGPRGAGGRGGRGGGGRGRGRRPERR